MSKYRPKVAQKIRIDVWIRDKFKCVYCNMKYSHRVQLTLDHKVPLSKGGKNTKDNLVTACKQCNGNKGSLTYDEYLIHMNRGLSKGYINHVTGHRNA
tara:strand:+ start:92 stop:385 length:294 start_codon:yes stop_codon:yes gene_type:complete